MPLYTFYPRTSTGAALMFEAFDVVDDTQARVCARDILDQHQSAASIEVFCGERAVDVLSADAPQPYTWDSTAQAARRSREG